MPVAAVTATDDVSSGHGSASAMETDHATVPLEERRVTADTSYVTTSPSSFIAGAAPRWRGAQCPVPAPCHLHTASLAPSVKDAKPDHDPLPAQASGSAQTAEPPLDTQPVPLLASAAHEGGTPGGAHERAFRGTAPADAEYASAKVRSPPQPRTEHDASDAQSTMEKRRKRGDVNMTR